jgi:hypothetical protein
MTAETLVTRPEGREREGSADAALPVGSGIELERLSRAFRPVRGVFRF